MSTSVKTMSRRDFLDYAAKGGLAFGAGATGVSTFADFARAQGNDDEHFFIFVELRGGLHWITATDGRDLAKLPLDDPKRCLPFKITETPPTPEEYAAIVQTDSMARNTPNGDFILLPYIGDLQSSYKKGTTNLGCEYVLGFAGMALEPYVNDIAVVRGIHMQGDFHGINNANGEMFSGLNSAETPHVASIMTSLLTPKYGSRLLDNLVFENATFSIGNSNIARMPIRLDAESLGYIIANADDVGDEAAAARFAKARELADALTRMPTLSELHRKVFANYVGAMKEAPTVRSMLLKLKSELTAVDASLDLDLQFKTAVTLMQAGLARVITLCLGTPNGKNKVDGFGLFDAHIGTYNTYEEDPTRANTARHHLNVERAMSSLAAFVKTLKETKFGNTTKSLFDVTTVVVGTEFARPSNFAGNEASGGEGGTAFGSGHYNFNNNYILFGKGVKGGAWIGKSEDVRQMGYKVDMTTAASETVEGVKMTPVEFGGGDGGSGAIFPEGLDYKSDIRPLMSRDIVRTVLASAGQDERYGEAYADERVLNAKTLKPILKG